MHMHIYAQVHSAVDSFLHYCSGGSTVGMLGVGVAIAAVLAVIIYKYRAR